MSFLVSHKPTHFILSFLFVPEISLQYDQQGKGLDPSRLLLPAQEAMRSCCNLRQQLKVLSHDTQPKIKTAPLKCHKCPIYRETWQRLILIQSKFFSYKRDRKRRSNVYGAITSDQGPISLVTGCKLLLAGSGRHHDQVTLGHLGCRIPEYKGALGSGQTVSAAAHPLQQETFILTLSFVLRVKLMSDTRSKETL